MTTVLHSHGKNATLLCFLFGTGFLTANLIGAPPGESAQIAGLLVSDRAEDVAKGEALLQAEQPAIVHALLARIRTGDTGEKRTAAYELELIMSPWIRGKEAGERFLSYTGIDSPRRPVERPLSHPDAAAARKVLMSAIAELPDRIAQPPKEYLQTRNAIGVLYEAMGEVADDATMDWAMRRLEESQVSDFSHHLFRFAEGYLGIPPLYEQFGLCGLSTPAERKEFEERRTREFNTARESILSTWQKVRPLGLTDRIRFSIKSWRERIVSRQKSSSGHYHLDGRIWLFRHMESIIRFGTPAVDLLRAQQAQETTLEARGVWEVVICAITGSEDERLMRELLAGRDPHLELVAEIVVASGSKKWLPELDELQYRHGDRFTRAILSAHREEGIPALQRVVARKGSNSFAKGALRELADRAEKGPPPNMRRFSFP